MWNVLIQPLCRFVWISAVKGRKEDVEKGRTPARCGPCRLRGGIARFLSVMMFLGHGAELECRTVMHVVGIGIPDSFCRLSACVRLLCWLENSPSGVFFRSPLVLLRRIRSDQFSVQMGDDNLSCISVESDFVETPGLVSSFVRV